MQTMITIGLRLIEKLHASLVKLAAKNQRSLQGEIVYALIEYVRSQGIELPDEDLQKKPKPKSKRA
jgi:hypothetical protein